MVTTIKLIILILKMNSDRQINIICYDYEKALNSKTCND